MTDMKEIHTARGRYKFEVKGIGLRGRKTYVCEFTPKGVEAVEHVYESFASPPIQELEEYLDRLEKEREEKADSDKKMIPAKTGYYHVRGAQPMEDRVYQVQQICEFELEEINDLLKNKIGIK